MIIGLDTLYANDPTSARYGAPINMSRDVFLATGRARDMLVEAFSRLPNLRSVGLRDYEGQGRVRDGEKARWRSYGWSLGDLSVRSSMKLASPESSLLFLLFALNEASVKPTNLEAFLRHSQLPDCSFDLSVLPASVGPVLSSLETVLLSLKDSPPLHGKNDITQYRHLKDFLQHTPRLVHLRLNFMPSYLSWHMADGFLGWLGTPFGAVSKPGEPAPIALDHLTTLDLGMLSLRPATLLQVVSKFANLKSLSLWKVTLSSYKGAAGDALRAWPDCLPKLGRAFQTPDNVSSVMIGFAGATPPRSGTILAVKFASKTSINQNGEKEYEDAVGKVSYRKRVGSNVQEWFDDLGEKAFVEIAGSPADSLDISDDSEDDDDDENDDDDDDDDEGNGLGSTDDEG